MVKAKLILTAQEAMFVAQLSDGIAGGGEIRKALEKAETSPSRGGRSTLRIFVTYQTADRLSVAVAGKPGAPPALARKVSAALAGARKRTRVKQPRSTVARDRRARHITGGE